MHVCLFLSRGGSLELWHKLGILERELSLYRKLDKHKFIIISYGNSEIESQLIEKYKNIEVLYNSFNLPSPIYTILIPILFWNSLRNIEIIKTNQMNGSEVATLCAKLYRKPLVLRFGFLFSLNLRREYGRFSLKYIYSILLEFLTFNLSSAIVVTSEAIKERVVKRKEDLKEKIFIEPNFVNTKIFKILDVAKVYDIVFVGRISKEKNIESIIKVALDKNLKFKIVGNGPLLEELQEKYLRYSHLISFSGVIENNKLPKVIQSAKIFILFSSYEGNPKSLLEAMSCGMPVIGSNVEGIKDIIDHNKNGVLADTNMKSLTESIDFLIEDQNLINNISLKARKFILKNHNLQKILEKEENIYQKLGK